MRALIRVVLGVLSAIVGIAGAVMFIAGIATDRPGGFIVLAVGLIVIGVLLGWAAVAIGGSRPCPRCGKGVRKGLVVCPTCGFDFGTLVPEQRPPPGSA
jgi:hypothetical protein